MKAIRKIYIALALSAMAIAAARFIFNGAPAFAMTSAWILVIALDKIDIKGARKTYRSIGGNRFQAFRKSVKIRHVAVVFIVDHDTPAQRVVRHGFLDTL